jgi:hypothetical protein
MISSKCTFRRPDNLDGGQCSDDEENNTEHENDVNDRDDDDERRAMKRIKHILKKL